MKNCIITKSVKCNRIDVSIHYAKSKVSKKSYASKMTLNDLLEYYNPEYHYQIIDAWNNSQWQ